MTNSDLKSKMKVYEMKVKYKREAKKKCALIVLSAIVISLIYLLIRSCIPNIEIVDKEGSESLGEINIVNLEFVDQQIPEDIEPKIIFNNADYETKKQLIIDRLKYNGVSDSDIHTFISIFEMESCRNKSDEGCFSTTKTPKTIVYHCERPNGSKVAVEVISRNGVVVQASCSDYGFKTTYEEKSWGLAQILETTWKGYGCKGDIKTSTYEQQVDCAVKIQKTSGWNAWSTYKLINN